MKARRGTGNKQPEHPTTRHTNETRGRPTREEKFRGKKRNTEARIETARPEEECQGKNRNSDARRGTPMQEEH
jgi:hypothetical protein